MKMDVRFVRVLRERVKEEGEEEEEGTSLCNRRKESCNFSS